jgi:hypothetical protein
MAMVRSTAVVTSVIERMRCQFIRRVQTTRLRWICQLW